MVTYFSMSFIQLVDTDFAPSGNSILLVRTILLLVEIIIGIRRKQFWKKQLILAGGKLLFRPVEIIFLHFSEILANWSIYFSQYFILASEIKFFVYWKQYCFILRFFLLAETMIEMRGKSIFKEEPLDTNFCSSFYE